MELEHSRLLHAAVLRRKDLELRRLRLQIKARDRLIAQQADVITSHGLAHLVDFAAVSAIDDELRLSEGEDEDEEEEEDDEDDEDDDEDRDFDEGGSAASGALTRASKRQDIGGKDADDDDVDAGKQLSARRPGVRLPHPDGPFHANGQPVRFPPLSDVAAGSSSVAAAAAAQGLDPDGTLSVALAASEMARAAAALALGKPSAAPAPAPRPDTKARQSASAGHREHPVASGKRPTSPVLVAPPSPALPPPPPGSGGGDPATALGSAWDPLPGAASGHAGGLGAGHSGAADEPAMLNTRARGAVQAAHAAAGAAQAVVKEVEAARGRQRPRHAADHAAGGARHGGETPDPSGGAGSGRRLRDGRDTDAPRSGRRPLPSPVNAGPRWAEPADPLRREAAGWRDAGAAPQRGGAGAPLGLVGRSVSNRAGGGNGPAASRWGQAGDNTASGANGRVRRATSNVRSGAGGGDGDGGGRRRHRAGAAQSGRGRPSHGGEYGQVQGGLLRHPAAPATGADAALGGDAAGGGLGGMVTPRIPRGPSEATLGMQGRNGHGGDGAPASAWHRRAATDDREHRAVGGPYSAAAAGKLERGGPSRAWRGESVAAHASSSQPTLPDSIASSPTSHADDDALGGGGADPGSAALSPRSRRHAQRTRLAKARLRARRVEVRGAHGGHTRSEADLAPFSGGESGATDHDSGRTPDPRGGSGRAGASSGRNGAGSSSAAATPAAADVGSSAASPHAHARNLKRRPSWPSDAAAGGGGGGRGSRRRKGGAPSVSPYALPAGPAAVQRRRAGRGAGAPSSGTSAGNVSGSGAGGSNTGASRFAAGGPAGAGHSPTAALRPTSLPAAPEPAIEADEGTGAAADREAADRASGHRAAEGGASGDGPAAGGGAGAAQALRRAAPVSSRLQPGGRSQNVANGMLAAVLPVPAPSGAAAALMSPGGGDDAVPVLGGGLAARRTGVSELFGAPRRDRFSAGLARPPPGVGVSSSLAPASAARRHTPSPPLEEPRQSDAARPGGLGRRVIGPAPMRGTLSGIGSQSGDGDDDASLPPPAPSRGDEAEPRSWGVVPKLSARQDSQH